MDNTTLESHLITLMRIVTGLFAMAGFDGKTLPARGERSFPRPLHRAVTTLLRPAESATRRLIICMAHGLNVSLPKPRPEGQPVAFFQRCQAAKSGHVPSATYAASSRPPRLPNFPLFDPLLRRSLRKRRRGLPDQPIPRIRSFDFDPRVPTIVPPRPPAPPPPPTRNASVDAAKLLRRLAVLGHALETMPKQARRFARWCARRDEDLANKRKTRWPLRTRPPGGRNAKHKNRREIDEMLVELNDLAWDAAWPIAWADALPDTS